MQTEKSRVDLSKPQLGSRTRSPRYRIVLLVILAVVGFVSIKAATDLWRKKGSAETVLIATASSSIKTHGVLVLASCQFS